MPYSPRLVVRIRMETDGAHHLAALVVEGDEGDGTRIIELRQAGEEGVAEIAHRREEAKAQILRRDLSRRSA